MKITTKGLSITTTILISITAVLNVMTCINLYHINHEDDARASVNQTWVHPEPAGTSYRLKFYEMNAAGTIDLVSEKVYSSRVGDYDNCDVVSNALNQQIATQPEQLNNRFFEAAFGHPVNVVYVQCISDSAK
jgi:hypothetical protein